MSIAAGNSFLRGAWVNFMSVCFSGVFSSLTEFQKRIWITGLAGVSGGTQGALQQGCGGQRAIGDLVARWLMDVGLRSGEQGAVCSGARRQAGGFGVGGDCLIKPSRFLQTVAAQ
jgi:hypothetical protein